MGLPPPLLVVVLVVRVPRAAIMSSACLKIAGAGGEAAEETSRPPKALPWVGVAVAAAAAAVAVACAHGYPKRAQMPRSAGRSMRVEASRVESESGVRGGRREQAALASTGCWRCAGA